MITGFILSILTMVLIMVGFVMPRYYDAFVPIGRRGEGKEPTVATETKGELGGRPARDTIRAESGRAALDRTSSDEHTWAEGKGRGEDRRISEGIMR